MSRFRSPSRPEQQHQFLKRNCYRYSVKGAALCIFISLIVHSFSLSRYLHNSQQEWQHNNIQSKEKQKSNLPSIHGRKSRVVAISSLQYELSKSKSDPRPVLVPKSKLLMMLDTNATSLATNNTSIQFTESSIPTNGNFIS